MFDSAMAPLISIIVPVYRGEKFLAQALQSVRDQTFAWWECLIVDDGSPDGTLAVAKKLTAGEDRFRVLHQENAGVAAARNHGLSMLHPAVKYVTCLDQDDVYLPDALTVLITELEAHPEAVAAHALADFTDQDGQPLSPGEFAAFGRNRLTYRGRRLCRVAEDQPTTFASVFTASTMFPPSLMLTRREIVESVGGYDTAVSPADDWDFLLRICRHGDVRFVNEIIVMYRRHASNQSAAASIEARCRLVRHRAFHSPENTAEHRRIVRESWRAIQCDLIGKRWREAVDGVKKVNLPKAGLKLAAIPFIAYRYFRGYPTLGWL